MANWLASVGDLFIRLAGISGVRHAAKIALLLVLALVAYRIVRAALNNLGRLAGVERDPAERARLEQRARTVASILDNVTRVGLGVVVVILALREAEYDVTALLAGAGIVGIAIGFGAQSLIKDFFSGFFIVFESQFGLGDQVTVAGHTGTVERLTLRVTVLRDVEGNLHLIPNGRIDTVMVLSKEWARATVDVTVPYAEDLSRALAATTRVVEVFAAENPESVVEPPEVLGVHDLGPRGVSIRASIKTPPGRNLAVGRELRRRLKLAFDEDGISFAHTSDDVPPAAVPK